MAWLDVLLCIFCQFVLASWAASVKVPGQSKLPATFNDEHVSEEHESNHTERYEVATFDWDHVQAPFTITLWILLASVAKIGFHLSKKFTSIFPDSSLLIVLGLVVGLILYFINSVNNNSFHLDSNVFFLYLLPPIVFDAGYFMPNRAFFDNLGTILTYAVIGTVWNAMTIGLSLWAVGQTGLFSMDTPLLSVLLFASLISAVDPVAVLVVFEEIHVNEILYIVVFGESLLNDAITVVLYHMFQGFSNIGIENIIPQDIGLGLVSFFVVGLGGVAIGLVWAVITGFTTRWTKHTRVLEPLFVFAMAYASYLSAEMLHLSGILAIVFCGIAMKQYVEGNISHKSQTTVKYFLKMLSSSSETIMYESAVHDSYLNAVQRLAEFVNVSGEQQGAAARWCVWRDLISVVCGTNAIHVVAVTRKPLQLFLAELYSIFTRIGVVLQTFFVNKLRLVKLSKVDQFIMAYGGLRGAIAYGLVVALDENVIKAKQMYVTATIVVIYFTVFLQGMTIKPLVNFLKVKKDDKRERTMNEQISDRLIDHFLSGVEDILGHRGHHWLRDKYEYYNNKYLKRWLLREPPKMADGGILEAFTKMSVREAMDHLARYGSFHSLAKFQSESLSHLIRSHSQPSFVYGRESSVNVNVNIVSDDSGNPCLDMNVFDAFVGKKIESDSKLHHLLMETSSHKRSKKSKNIAGSGDNAAFESTKRYAEQYKLRRLIKDKAFKEVQYRAEVERPDSASSRKAVSFFVADEATDRSPHSPDSLLPNGVLPEDSGGFSVPYVYDPVEDTPRIEHELTAAERELPWKRQNSTPPTVKRDFIGCIPVDSRRGSSASNAADGSESGRSGKEQSRPRAIVVTIDEREEMNAEHEVSSL